MQLIELLLCINLRQSDQPPSCLELWGPKDVGLSLQNWTVPGKPGRVSTQLLSFRDRTIYIWPQLSSGRDAFVARSL